MKQVWTQDPPWIHPVGPKIADGVSVTFPPTGLTAVVRIDGAATSDEYRLLEAVSEGFRFPAYFGWNFDALIDCLRDLSWYEADRYLVVIERSDSLLGGDTASLTLLASAFVRSGAHWASPSMSGRTVPVAFNVVLFDCVSSLEFWREKANLRSR
ncbi:barstar family protein [Solwaraspora sp. WMMD406]|uniref:barstar family protein n=1 Tax=Solwaraspora sp. WMMD406 TaxID=3016095 RepID=UPI002415C65A|nr:barstar family protein [Solwaraspora sp. WMMD406]MDG4763443.1 barstar family protein [Solwaraspora sp. WMMD406]